MTVERVSVIGEWVTGEDWQGFPTLRLTLDVHEVEGLVHALGAARRRVLLGQDMKSLGERLCEWLDAHPDEHAVPDIGRSDGDG